MPPKDPRWRTEAIMKKFKNRVISTSVERFWENLARWCVSTGQTRHFSVLACETAEINVKPRNRHSHQWLHCKIKSVRAPPFLFPPSPSLHLSFPAILLFHPLLFPFTFFSLSPSLSFPLLPLFVLLSPPISSYKIRSSFVKLNQCVLMHFYIKKTTTTGNNFGDLFSRSNQRPRSNRQEIGGTASTPSLSNSIGWRSSLFPFNLSADCVTLCIERIQQLTKDFAFWQVRRVPFYCPNNSICKYVSTYLTCI